MTRLRSADPRVAVRLNAGTRLSVRAFQFVRCRRRYGITETIARCRDCAHEGIFVVDTRACIPFQLNRTASSSTRRSMAEWTIGITSRQLVPRTIARATSLGQTVAFGDRDARSASVISRASAITACGACHASTASTSSDPVWVAAASRQEASSAAGWSRDPLRQAFDAPRRRSQPYWLPLMSHHHAAC